MTQRTKNVLLIIALVLLAAIAYRYAIVNTLELKREYKRLGQDVDLLENMPSKLSSLKQRKIYHDSLLTRYQLGESSIQNSMLNTINTFAISNNLKVVEFIEPHKVAKNDLIVNTYQFSLEGHYNDMISLIHKLEQQTKFGEFINLNFKKYKNYKTGKSYLQVNVLLRSFG
ncbi:type 4a pilus biogenesis protein PilO [uncultured Psychroserpens sp.]|uniref:type 4a pilus biogenesis protein PilO n=1 Tax=uncultured Psychroserpens sp. TaxID=255436 RepID=UPI002623D8E6|nr:type 4a pilus biogenesis protein PilO [uncultured Psychroserpens sp.]